MERAIIARIGDAGLIRAGWTQVALAEAVHAVSPRRTGRAVLDWLPLLLLLRLCREVARPALDAFAHPSHWRVRTWRAGPAGSFDLRLRKVPLRLVSSRGTFHALVLGVNIELVVRANGTHEPMEIHAPLGVAPSKQSMPVAYMSRVPRLHELPVANWSTHFEGIMLNVRLLGARRAVARRHCDAVCVGQVRTGSTFGTLFVWVVVPWT